MNGAAKTTMGVLGGVLALTLILALFVGGGMYGPMMGGFGDGGMMGNGPVVGGWSGYGWLWMVLSALFWIGLLVVIVWTVARVFPEGLRTGAPDAEAILRERLARGEIDAEEYERTLRIIRDEGREFHMKLRPH